MPNLQFCRSLLIVYNHHLVLFRVFDLACRSKYNVISNPLSVLILYQCLRKYCSRPPVLHGPVSFQAWITSATAYSFSLHTNRPGRPGSARVIPAGSNVPATGSIGSLINSSLIDSPPCFEFFHDLHAHRCADPMGARR